MSAFAKRSAPPQWWPPGGEQIAGAAEKNDSPLAAAVRVAGDEHGDASRGAPP